MAPGNYLEFACTRKRGRMKPVDHSKRFAYQRTGSIKAVLVFSGKPRQDCREIRQVKTSLESNDSGIKVLAQRFKLAKNLFSKFE